ncbi:MAG: hypothetical protein ACO32I_07560 [Candidatus Limnocylindrus sp.]
MSADREILLKMMYNEEPYWKFIGKHKIHLDYEKDLRKVKKLKEFQKLRSLKKFRKLNDHLIFRMVHLLYPDIFEPFILGDKFKKVIGMNLRFPIEDVMYVFENFFENEKLIRHFLHLLNTKIARSSPLIRSSHLRCAHLSAATPKRALATRPTTRDGGPGRNWRKQVPNCGRTRTGTSPTTTGGTTSATLGYVQF